MGQLCFSTSIKADVASVGSRGCLKYAAGRRDFVKDDIDVKTISELLLYLSVAYIVHVPLS